MQDVVRFLPASVFFVVVHNDSRVLVATFDGTV